MFINGALTNTQRAKIARELVQLLENLVAASPDLCKNIELGNKMELIRPARFFRDPVYMKRTLLLTPAGLIETSVKGTRIDSYFHVDRRKPPSSKNFSSSDFKFVVNTYSLDTEALKDVLNRIKA